MKKATVLLIAIAAIVSFKSYANTIKFLPTTVGWYRITSAYTLQGGTVTIAGGFDNRNTDVEFQYDIGAYGVGGSIQQTRYSSYNNGNVDQVRISSDGSATTYLDIHIYSADHPDSLTIDGYGPVMAAFISSPVVGATAGSTNVNVLALSHGFNTTQGATFAQTGGNVGIGTTSPTGVFSVQTDPTYTNGLNVNQTSGDPYLEQQRWSGTSNLYYASRVKNNNGNITFELTNSAAAVGSQSFTEMMRVTPSGNVGIGTTTPGSKLDVNGNLTVNASGTALQVYGNASFANALTVNGTFNRSGDIGVGNMNALGTMANIYSATVTDYSTASGTTIPLVTGVFAGTPTYKTNSSTGIIITKAPSVYIDGPPIAGSGVSITNAYSLYVNSGNSWFNGNIDADGTIHSQEVKVDMTGWEDRVFKRSYKLPTLSTVKTYIDLNHHLPDMPSESELVKTGLNLGSMEKTLTKKVEELTLYLIEKDKQNSDQQREIDLLKLKDENRQNELATLKRQLDLLANKTHKNSSL